MVNSDNPDQLAILGGTFDPIHLGHTIPAKKIANWLGLTKVTLMPAHIPPHKATPAVSSATRSEMVRLVCQLDPLFELDTRELERDKPSYTIDTLTEIKNERPDTQIFFLVGMDSLLNFTKWVQWRQILKLCHLVVSTRPGYDLAKLPSATKELLVEYQCTKEEVLAKNAGGILLAPPCQQDISSTAIRAALSNTLSADQWLPPEVAKYISLNKLYQNQNKSH